MRDNTQSYLNRRRLQSLLFAFGGVSLLWVVTGWILTGSLTQLSIAGLAVVLLAITVKILNDWRSGFILFFIWLLFEDLPRKYLGNNMVIYFGKDILAAVTYLSFFLALRRNRVETFRPPFLLPLSLFFWFSCMQVFNPGSPHILYGLLGLKLYFYYVPLMFVSYALVRTEGDLRKVMFANAVLGGCIALLGVIQSIVGHDFLNPSQLAPELQNIGRLTRISPLTGQLVRVPTSVFVSGGRFAWYLILLWILLLGSLGYLLLRRGRKTTLMFAALGIVTVAAVVSGARSTVVHISASALVLSAGFLWGAPWRWGKAYRLTKALRRAFIVAGISLVLMTLFFPQTIGANWAFYVETLSPDSPRTELLSRSWNYPLKNLLAAFDSPVWPYGRGLGTSSLGVQYVSRLLGGVEPLPGVESGFGALVLETGVLGLLLWMYWSLHLLRSGWRVLRQLRETPLFPLGFSILWFAFLVLQPFMTVSIQCYQNFVYNAYLWVMIGVLFRLPALVARQPHAQSTGGVRHRENIAAPALASGPQSSPAAWPNRPR